MQLLYYLFELMINIIFLSLEKSECRINSPHSEDEEPTEIFPRMDSVKN